MQGRLLYRAKIRREIQMEIQERARTSFVSGEFLCSGGCSSVPLGAALARVFEQVSRLRHGFSSLDLFRNAVHVLPYHCSMISTIASATSVVAPMSRTSSRCSSSALPTTC